MNEFTATHLITINFKQRHGWGSCTSWDDVNKEIDDFIKRITIQLKGKRYWKRYAKKGDQRLIKAHGDPQFGSTRDFPHAHIHIEKPNWCDECVFINAVHHAARLSPLAKKDASAVDVRRSDYRMPVRLYGIREDRLPY